MPTTCQSNVAQCVFSSSQNFTLDTINRKTSKQNIRKNTLRIRRVWRATLLCCCYCVLSPFLLCSCWLALLYVCVMCESVCALLFHCADLQCFFCIFYTLRICFLRLAWSNKMAHLALPCLFCAARVCVCVCVLLLIMLLSKLAAALIHTNNAKSIWRASQ